MIWSATKKRRRSHSVRIPCNNGYDVTAECIVCRKMAYYNKKPVVICYEKDTRHLLFCGGTWHIARPIDRKYTGSGYFDHAVVIVGL